MKPDDQRPEEEWFHALFATLRHAAERQGADLTQTTLERLRAREDDPRFMPPRLDGVLREMAAQVVDAWLALVRRGGPRSKPGPGSPSPPTEDER